MEAMPSPAIALSVGIAVIVVLVLLAWPGWGLLARLRSAGRRGQRVLGEDGLKYVHGCEMAGKTATLEGVAGALSISADRAARIVEGLQDQELVEIGPGGFEVTARGRETALHILRAHRLWEQYLSETTGFESSEWHDRAEQREHELSLRQMESISARLGHPTHDPHGDPIPSASGELAPPLGEPLTLAPLDAPLRVVHIEDEPEVVYAQLMAEGVHLGQFLRLIDVTPKAIRYWADGDEHVLAPLIAANLAVVKVSAEEEVAPIGTRLSELSAGERGRVVSISGACRGPERRRLFDLGMLPGTEVSAELVSPGGDPKAYRVRGAIIALRKEQSDWIEVERVDSSR
jgi:DtxR family Mn-dependent transcriptional regulator